VIKCLECGEENTLALCNECWKSIGARFPVGTDTRFGDVHDNDDRWAYPPSHVREYL
jgi:hypothetical protein